MLLYILLKCTKKIFFTALYNWEYDFFTLKNQIQLSCIVFKPISLLLKSRNRGNDALNSIKPELIIDHLLSLQKYSYLQFNGT